MYKKEKRELLLGIVSVLLSAGAAWIAYPSLVTFFLNSNIRSNLSSSGTATLTWNADTESNLAGYKIYYGTSPRTGSDPKVCGLCGYAAAASVGKVTTYRITNLIKGATYYFSVSAVNTAQKESSFSAEVSKLIP